MHQDFSFSGTLQTEPIAGDGKSFQLRIGQGRVEDYAARGCCVDGKESRHSIDFTLEVYLALDRQNLVQDLLDDLVRRAFGTDTHEIGGHFEGVELAL